MDNRMTARRLQEMDKLALGLNARSINYIRKPCFDGEILICKDWDAICHSFSYGHELGLLEIMGSIVKYETGDNVEGMLTAEEILKRL